MGQSPRWAGWQRSSTPNPGVALAWIFFLCLSLGSVVARAQADPQGLAIASKGAGGGPACSSCHGAKGEGNAVAGFPYLAGLGSGYLAEQLADMASGARQSAVMAPIAKSLSVSQRQALARYYSELPPPYDVDRVAASANAEARKQDVGAWLATRGDWDKNVPACNQCHGPGAIGVGDAFPALAGQSQAYLVAQLQGWRTGKRYPGPLALMPAIATRLSEAEIDAVAAYYAGLPDAKAPAAEQPAVGAKP